MRVLEKYLTRDVPLIAIESWYEGRIKYFKNFFRIPFPTTLFLSTKHAFEWYIDLRDFDYRFPKKLAVWSRSRQNRKKLPLVRQFMRTGLNYFRGINRSVKIKKTITLVELIRYLSEVKQLLARGYPGVLVTHHFPRWDDQFRKEGRKLFYPKSIKEIMKWRATEGDVFLDHGSSTIYYLLNQIAKKKKWNSYLLKYITLKELESAVRFKRKLPTAKLKKRQEKRFIFFDGKIIYEPGLDRKLKALRVKLRIDTDSDGFSFLKGTVANRGHVKGRVKVIFSRRQLASVEKGNILITPMTSPWYLPAMKKASAIVTDEGGAASHAAIISREMKKPCIVGTKIATKVFKDGDLVEVDANQGIVKILKKR